MDTAEQVNVFDWNQRRVTLHGVLAREIPEELKRARIRREIRLLIPELFSGMLPSCQSFFCSMKAVLFEC